MKETERGPQKTQQKCLLAFGIKLEGNMHALELYIHIGAHACTKRKADTGTGEMPNNQDESATIQKIYPFCTALLLKASSFIVQLWMPSGLVL